MTPIKPIWLRTFVMAKILLISFFHSNMATVHPPLIRKLAIKSSYFGYTIFGPNENLCSRRI